MPADEPISLTYNERRRFAEYLRQLAQGSVDIAASLDSPLLLASARDEQGRLNHLADVIEGKPIVRISLDAAEP